MSAQIKTVIDRFCSANHILMNNRKHVFLLATAYDDNDWTFRALLSHYQAIVQYLGWIDDGQILAGGCGSRSDIERTEFGKQAYQLGKTLQ